ncbi:hypothetical protein KKE26_05975 [bacterium]|nr:hypothetical protein [bacterium]MBU1754404.1 hypothetical protein [bacterium]
MSKTFKVFLTIVGVMFLCPVLQRVFSYILTLLFPINNEMLTQKDLINWLSLYLAVVIEGIVVLILITTDFLQSLKSCQTDKRLREIEENHSKQNGYDSN